MKFFRASAALLGAFLVFGSLLTFLVITKKKNSYTFSRESLVSKKNLVPVVVIGSGPAGLTAALFTARANFQTFVITGQEGGQLMEAAYVENWPSKPKLPGRQMMQDLKEQVQQFGAHLVPTYVEHIDLSRYPFVVHLANGDELNALTIIAATGGAQRTLEIPGVKEYWAKGIGVCTICDAPFDKDKEVAVIGGGDAACDKALQLAAFAKKVTILVRDKEMRAAAVVQKYVKDTPVITIRYNCDVEKIDGDHTRASSVYVKDSSSGKEEILPIHTVYFALGFTPNSQLFKGKLKLDKNGYIIREPGTQKTSIEGVFAAGNIEDPMYQKASVAAGAGARAGIDSIQFLQERGFTPTMAHDLDRNIYRPQATTQFVVRLANDEDVEKCLKDHSCVVLELYAKTCPVCKMVSPYFEQASANYKGEVYCTCADIETVPQSSQKFKLDATPFFILFKDGKEHARSTRIRSYQDIVDFINKNKK